MSVLEGLAPQWLWFILAIVLGIAEMIAPGFFLIWIGGAALIAGVAALIGIPLSGQVLVFGVSALALVYVGRRYFRVTEIASDDPLLNNRGARLIGETVTAVEPVDASHGRVRVGDSVWSARGAEAAPGDRLRITGIDGSVLLVERV